VGGLRLLSGPVIQEAARHLVDVIERPTPSEYSNFVEALFLAHPSLQYSDDPDVKCQVQIYPFKSCHFKSLSDLFVQTIIKKKITECIRNARKIDKKFYAL
jgi:hypothetical protein